MKIDSEISAKTREFLEEKFALDSKSITSVTLQQEAERYTIAFSLKETTSNIELLKQARTKICSVLKTEITDVVLCPREHEIIVSGDTFTALGELIPKNETSSLLQKHTIFKPEQEKTGGCFSSLSTCFGFGPK